MEDQLRASKEKRIVCPFCEGGRLVFFGTDRARCGSCGLALLGWALKTLRDVAGLPNAPGAHACECGHPEMRKLPDGVFHCPACRSEVLPFEAEPPFPNEAYRAGWMDGHLQEIEGMAGGERLAVWGGPYYDGLEYHRGHRAGRRAHLIGEQPEGTHAGGTR